MKKKKNYFCLSTWLVNTMAKLNLLAISIIWFPIPWSNLVLKLISEKSCLKWKLILSQTIIFTSGWLKREKIKERKREGEGSPFFHSFLFHFFSFSFFHSFIFRFFIFFCWTTFRPYCYLNRFPFFFSLLFLLSFSFTCFASYLAKNVGKILRRANCSM